MTKLAEQVFIYFDRESGEEFTLDDDVLGELDGVGLLGGVIGTEVTAAATSYSITRGRTMELDVIQTGRATISLLNYDAAFTPFGGDDDFLVTDADEILADDTDDELTTEGLNNIRTGRRVTVVSDGITVFDGNTEDWQFSYSADRSVDCRLMVVDALGRLARSEFDEWTTTVDETPGERIESSLLRTEVDYPLSQTNLDVGTTTLQADLVSWGSNVLNYLQLVARTDFGRLFADRNNVLQFRSRNTASPAVTVSFSDATYVPGSGVIPFQSIDLDVSGALLYTDVSVDRVGGTAQTVFDSAARDEFDIRRLSLSGLLMSTDEQAEDLANYLSGVYREPKLRVRSLTVILDKLSGADRGAVLRLDIGDLVAVEWTPRGGTSALDQTLIVEGVNHQSSTSGPHQVSFQLSPSQQGFAFILDNPVLGELDSGVLSF